MMSLRVRSWLTAFEMFPHHCAHFLLPFFSLPPSFHPFTAMLKHSESASRKSPRPHIPSQCVCVCVCFLGRLMNQRGGRGRAAKVLGVRVCVSVWQTDRF